MGHLDPAFGGPSMPWEGDGITEDADLHLRVDGQRIRGVVANGVWTGSAPFGTRSLRLVSRMAIPADCTAQGRRVGVALSRIVLRGDNVARSLIASDPDADWGGGFHPVEQDCWSAWRWSNSDAELPSLLWQDIAGSFRIDLHVFRTLTYRRGAPVPESAAA